MYLAVMSSMSVLFYVTVLAAVYGPIFSSLVTAAATTTTMMRVPCTAANASTVTLTNNTVLYFVNCNTSIPVTAAQDGMGVENVSFVIQGGTVLPTIRASGIQSSTDSVAVLRNVSMYVRDVVMTSSSPFALLAAVNFLSAAGVVIEISNSVLMVDTTADPNTEETFMIRLYCTSQLSVVSITILNSSVSIRVPRGVADSLVSALVKLESGDTISEVNVSAMHSNLSLVKDVRASQLNRLTSSSDEIVCVLSQRFTSTIRITSIDCNWYASYLWRNNVIQSTAESLSVFVVRQSRITYGSGNVVLGVNVTVVGGTVWVSSTAWAAALDFQRLGTSTVADVNLDFRRVAVSLTSLDATTDVTRGAALLSVDSGLFQSGLVVTVQEVIASVEVTSWYKPPPSGSSPLHPIATLLYLSTNVNNGIITVKNCTLSLGIRNGTAEVSVASTSPTIFFGASGSLLEFADYTNHSNVSVTVSNCEVSARTGCTVVSPNATTPVIVTFVVGVLIAGGNCSQCSHVIEDSSLNMVEMQFQKIGPSIAGYEQGPDILPLKVLMNITGVYVALNTLRMEYAYMGAAMPSQFYSLMSGVHVSITRTWLSYPSPMPTLPAAGDVVAMIVPCVTSMDSAYYVDSSGGGGVRGAQRPVVLACVSGCNFVRTSLQATNNSRLDRFLISEQGQLSLQQQSRLVLANNALHLEPRVNSTVLGIPTVFVPRAVMGGLGYLGSLLLSENTSILVADNSFVGFATIVSPNNTALGAPGGSLAPVTMSLGCNLWDGRFLLRKLLSQEGIAGGVPEGMIVLPEIIAFRGNPNALCATPVTQSVSPTDSKRLPVVVTTSAAVRVPSAAVVWALTALSASGVDVGGGFSSASRMQIVLTAQELRTRCLAAESGDDPEPPSSAVLDNPLQLHVEAVGDEAAYSGGAVLGNCTLAAAVWLMMVGLRWLHDVLDRSERERAAAGAAPGLRERVAACVSIPSPPLPGSLALTYSVLVQPTTTAGLVLVCGAVAAGGVLLGVFGLAVSLLPLVVAGVKVLYHPLFPLVSVQHAHKLDVRSAGRGGGGALQLLLKKKLVQLFLSGERWVVRSAATTPSTGKAAAPVPSIAEVGRALLSDYSPLFECYRGGMHWYFVVDLGVGGIVAGVVAGAALAAPPSSACAAAAWGGWVLVGISALLLLLQVVLRPLAVLVDRYLATTCAGFALASQVLGQYDGYDAAANGLSVAVAVLSGFGLIVSVCRAVAKWVFSLRARIPVVRGGLVLGSGGKNNPAATETESETWLRSGKAPSPLSRPEQEEALERMIRMACAKSKA